MIETTTQPIIPNPGSDEAIALGCLCPVTDNGHSSGILWDGEEGGPFFWIREDCPLHGKQESAECAPSTMST